ncbi:uncharacterized protein LOC135307583 [Passer domesticus]|uniref:uncharacterized protein LOC135307583 n=1 Tax=Passer domesticus TaxID=48849 RepID=UPI0030FF11F0
MGNTLTQEQIETLSALQGVTEAYAEGVSKKELKELLLWVRYNYPFAETHVLFEVGFWQEVNRHLYFLAARKEETAFKLLSPARIMLEAISARCRRSARELGSTTPTRAGKTEHGSVQRLALVPIGPGGTAPEGEEQGEKALLSALSSQSPRRPPKRPETPETEGGSGSDSDANTIPTPEQLRSSPSEIEGSGTIVPEFRISGNEGAGEAEESGRGVRGGLKGDGETLSRGGVAATAAVATGGGGAEAVGNTSFGTGFGGPTPGVAALAGAVPKTHAGGETRGTSGKGSQITASTSDAGNKLGAAAELRAAPVSRRRGRTAVTQDPEVEPRRSARIAEQTRARAKQGSYTRSKVRSGCRHDT